MAVQMDDLLVAWMVVEKVVAMVGYSVDWSDNPRAEKMVQHLADWSG